MSLLSSHKLHADVATDVVLVPGRCRCCRHTRNSQMSRPSCVSTAAGRCRCCCHTNLIQMSLLCCLSTNFRSSDKMSVLLSRQLQADVATIICQRCVGSWVSFVLSCSLSQANARSRLVTLDCRTAIRHWSLRCCPRTMSAPLTMSALDVVIKHKQ